MELKNHYILGAFWLRKVFVPMSFVLAGGLLLQGCVDVSSKLNVLSDTAVPFVLKNDSGSVTIPPGKHPIQLSIARRGSDPSELAFMDLHQKFALRLPDAEKLLSITEPLVVGPEDLGQPVAMSFTRTPDYDRDVFTVSIFNSDQSTLLASAEFKYRKSDSVAYDEGSKSFLASFQKVRRSQRGLMVTINAGVIIEPFNGIVNHSAQVYLAPWVYARYSTVRWGLGSGDIRQDWQDLVKSSPVVDYFALNHGGTDFYNMGQSDGLPWKQHQLRLVYTEGCDSASSRYFEQFLGTYGAAVAIGHRATSASPFYSFPLIHAWTYGETALNSARAGRRWGAPLNVIANVVTLGTLGTSLWENQKDMLHGSELGLAWTSELPPNKLDIDSSAMPMRDTPERRVVTLSFIDTFNKDNQFKTLDGEGLETGSVSASGTDQPLN